MKTAPLAAGWILIVRLGLAQEPADPVPLWMEAEHHRAQQGATAPEYAMPTASGGACVNNDWGGAEGHFLRYEFRVPEASPWTSGALHLTVRYAREMPGPAKVRLQIDENPALAVDLELPSTGGWGFRPEDWRYAQVKLPGLAPGPHALEIRSVATRNNVNFDGYYLSPVALDLRRAPRPPPSGPDLVAPLGEGLVPLPCRTPVAVPYSRRKAVVSGNGLLQSLLSPPNPHGMGRNVPGPSLHVMLQDHGPWRAAEQELRTKPVPTVVTRLDWPEVVMEQAVFAIAPEERGFFLRVTVSNKLDHSRAVELVSLLGGLANLEEQSGARLVASGKVILQADPKSPIQPQSRSPGWPGPLGQGPGWRHPMTVQPHTTATLDLQFLGEGMSHETARAATAQAWRQWLAPAAVLQLPEPQLQHACEAALRQILALIEARPDHARILKGLEHYYGANPYDTFQASRALDAVGLRHHAQELLRHQLAHLKHDGIFEMWETGDLSGSGADQWIVQGLAATALWKHYQLWGDDAWLAEITPTLIKAAQATRKARQNHAGRHPQGNVEVEGWLPPIGGDGGLAVGYHWSQNAGPLAGLKIAAAAARLQKRPEAESLQAEYLDFQHAYDAVCQQTVAAADSGMIPAYPGATGDARFRPLWGVVMSVTPFEAISSADPAAVQTLRFLQQHRHEGLHLNLGYSQGVWPYLSAEVAQWHLQLGEFDEAWRILHALIARASPTLCWYEEIEHDPPRGFGDPADVWAAAELVYLTRQLILRETEDSLWIGPGLPTAWMQDGQTLNAQNLPTAWGPCSLHLQFHKDSASAQVQLPTAKRPETIQVWLMPHESSSWQVDHLQGAAHPQRQGRSWILSRPAEKVAFSLHLNPSQIEKR